MSVAQRVRSDIAKMEDGAVFLVADLPSYQTDRKATIKALSYYASSKKLKAKYGEVSRIADGLYYKVKVGTFGKRPPSYNAVLSALMISHSDTVGYIYGHQLFNTKGLSTQVPAITTLMTSKKNVPTKIDTPSIKIRVTRQDDPIVEKDILRHELAYILNNIKTIQALEKERLVSSLSEYFKFIANDAKQFHQLYKSLIYKKTKALFGALFAQYQQRSGHDVSSYLRTIKADLSHKSEYRWGHITTHISNKNDWHIIF